MQLPNHESFLVCPGKQPIKIGANYAVSIRIYFDDFVHRKNKNRQQQPDDGIFVHTADDDRGNRDNPRNNRINKRREIIKNASSSSQSDRRFNNKGSDAQMRINLIESNRDIKNIKSIKNGKIKHFIRIYHWTEIDKQTAKTSQSASDSRANKYKIENVFRGKSTKINNEKAPM